MVKQVKQFVEQQSPEQPTPEQAPEQAPAEKKLPKGAYAQFCKQEYDKEKEKWQTQGKFKGFLQSPDLKAKWQDYKAKLLSGGVVKKTKAKK